MVAPVKFFLLRFSVLNVFEVAYWLSQKLDVEICNADIECNNISVRLLKFAIIERTER